MKISKTIFAIAIAFTFLMASCRETPSKNGESTEENGHEHDAGGNHMDAEQMEQEEFMVDSTTIEMEKEMDTHNHDNGSEHHDH